MSCKDEDTRNGAKLPNGEAKSPAEKREELLDEFRKLGDYDPDLPADSALTELEAEADAVVIETDRLPGGLDQIQIFLCQFHDSLLG